MMQLNSFGCGSDSFFMNEIGDILKKAGKSHVVLCIDEIFTTGSIRLRLRSFVELLQTREPACNRLPYRGYERVYTFGDRGKTILVSRLTDFLSPFVSAIGELTGYRVENLPPISALSVEAGIKYGNAEVYYPATLVLGDIITAL
jgi:predicted nucleotide-binding protein (sugar kinase/HSP70/actin superfamily)